MHVFHLSRTSCRFFHPRFAKVLQDRGLNLLQSQGIQVLLGNVASEVTNDEVRDFFLF